MKKSHLLLTTLLALQLSCALAATALPEGAPPTQDIRVLIDVSGSMKKNDPGNLRTPALRLLTGLLPSGTQAGVWTFGRYVNMLIPYGTVNTAWRDQAMGAADRINSAGLYTDIEAALSTATWNWTASATGTRRSIILFTDGLVDLSDSADTDRQSRARITDKILPRLRDSGVVVYTIALSDGADEALLQQLAAATGGWFERADNADKLERIFFRMFEKAAHPDTLPLIDNEVLVDNTIDELTLLVFRKENAPPTTVTTPNGVVFDKARLPPNARWHNDARYDLVTIERPMSGTWHVNADIDPDNRVMVVTNLRVVATQLPNQILQGDTHDVLVRFTDKNRAVTQKEFLQIIKVNLVESNAAGETSNRLLLDNGRDGDITAGDGIFSLHLAGTMETGHHAIIVDVDGTTFKRQRRQDFEVVASPVIADIRADETGAMALFVIPRAGIINPETLRVTATVTGDGDLSATHQLTRSNPGEWRLALNTYPPEASHQVTLDIEAERPNGKPISFQSDPLHFGRAVAPLPEESSASANAAAEPAEAAAVEEPATEDSPDAETADTENPAHINWVAVISLVILLNALLAAGLFMGYRKFFGTKVNPAESEDLTAPEQSAAAAAVPTPAPATAMQSTQPSVATQVAAAAAAQTRTMATAGDTPTAQAMSNEPAVEPAVAGKVAPEADAAGTTRSSPDLVMEDTSGEAAPEKVDDQPKDLNVDEIDLGFEEKVRNVG